MSRVVEVSRDDLLRRREAILVRLNISLDEITVLAEGGLLVRDEWEAWEDLRDISFLLGAMS